MNTKPPLQVGIITLFPEIFAALQYGITGRAINQELINLTYYNPRDYTQDKYHQVDDRPYGGGPGMIMQYQPIADAIEAAQQRLNSAQVIYLSPQGQVLTHTHIKQLTHLKRPFIFICGRYAGIDERILDNYVDAEYSVGDYVVSGGEIPAMLLIDAMTRLLPQALGNRESIEQESFSREHCLLDYPHYTRPECIGGKTVPEVLLSGNHQAITHWREQQMWARTWQKRPDLVKRQLLTKTQRQLLQQALAKQQEESS